MPKRDKQTNLAHAARILGRKGGPARKNALSPTRRSQIAAEGGRAKAAKNK